MLKSSWKSKNLVFSEFQEEEAALAKSIFDSSASVVAVDPTFRAWPLEEYVNLIANSSQVKLPQEEVAFYLRKICTLQGDVVGYVQLEINAPSKGVLWLPMLAILPCYQGRGFGSEIASSVISVVQEYTFIHSVGLNVYAENISEFRFWFKQGFNQIRAFEKEVELGREYHCLVLYRELNR